MCQDLLSLAENSEIVSGWNRDGESLETAEKHPRGTGRLWKMYRHLQDSWARENVCESTTQQVLSQIFESIPSTPFGWQEVPALCGFANRRHTNF